MKYLVVESKDRMHGHKFPLNRTWYEVIGGTLYVTNRGVQLRFSLDSHDYKIETNKIQENEVKK